MNSFLTAGTAEIEVDETASSANWDALLAQKFGTIQKQHISLIMAQEAQKLRFARQQAFGRAQIGLLNWVARSTLVASVERYERT